MVKDYSIYLNKKISIEDINDISMEVIMLPVGLIITNNMKIAIHHRPESFSDRRIEYCKETIFPTKS